jgi:predicted transcriptional regulator
MSSFSEFFLNIFSLGESIEETFGLRAAPQILPPISYTILNTYKQHKEQPQRAYHNEQKQILFPIDELKNHPILQFQFPVLDNKKNTIATISQNTKIPKESVRKWVNQWLKIGVIYKDKDIGLAFNFDAAFKEKLFFKYNSNFMNRISKNWSALVDSLIIQGFLNDEHRLPKINFKNMSELFYIQNLAIQHWYYLMSLTYIENNKYVNYNEACILSSALFFYGDKTTNFVIEQKDLYTAKILRPVNISSISESTVIPLETVRRSVGEMIKKNLLKKQGNDIFVTPLVLGDTEIQIASKVKLSFLHDLLTIASILHTSPD